MARIINRMICAIFGHKRKLITKVYTRDGRRFVLENNLYHCERCGINYTCYGLVPFYVRDVINATLKDLPKLTIQHSGYELINKLWKKK